jgi:hypothetical protein
VMSGTFWSCAPADAHQMPAPTHSPAKPAANFVLLIDDTVAPP